MRSGDDQDFKRGTQKGTWQKLKPPKKRERERKREKREKRGFSDLLGCNPYYSFRILPPATWQLAQFNGLESCCML